MSNTTLITGANRGIGLQFVQQLLAQGDTVIACCRNPEQAAELVQLGEQFPHHLELVGLDVSQPEQLHGLKAYLGDRIIDTLINNAGLYGPKGLHFGEVDSSGFNEVMQVNVLAPLLLVQTLSDNLARNSKIAILSSMMGSISDNQSGGAYLYRASKSAVNAIGKSLANDLAPRGVAVILLHPGWVQTEMGGPNALIDTQTSVEGMLKVIAALNLDNSGEFRNYDGRELGW
ncbi:SDR family oxidoreductase [Ferrimonas lipolytica]|uniref:SDR family oxidoreductase n=1 Tax=Ferrimonas lipolytica TaxID=2724191 RepID=A0A6H1UEL9_9GAMM|nr:SDR family oxidoreductase [Ferrimonas lipolytica]QIZ77040.1 SDR family oxidoreductase [Ferrimonas lipolytica]